MVFTKCYNDIWPHWAFKAAAPIDDQPRLLTPREEYLKGQKVNPPSWSRWEGGLERPGANSLAHGQDQTFNQSDEAPSKTAVLVST